ncbi:MAG TPA: hypothetical protein DD381_12125 [Lentisphaeria bacterium]|nr:MAG: hypothetical protein A2X47_09605 [Lentisphaerae bacterium GWF2_38_69]HBM17073.1 hypothetical protein [Lentisphaeria bacterium]
MIRIELKKKFKKDEMNFFFKLTSNRIVIFGPSGCGKTTLLKMICGICTPDSGFVSVKNRCLYSSADSIDLPVYERNIGYLPQESALFPNMKVKDNILYGSRRSETTADKKRFCRLVDKLQIESKLEEYPASLSGGQKQRAALARTLMINPCILLLDEPFTGLDSPIKNCLRDIVIDIADDESIPLLFVSHNIEDCYCVGKELVVMDNGEVIEFGQSTEILENPKLSRTARLFDYRNIWPIEKIEDNGGLVHLKNGIMISSCRKISDSFKYLCVRPEKIRVLNVDKEKSPGIINSFYGTILEDHGRGAYRSLLFLSDSGYRFEVNVSETYLKKTNLAKSDRALIYLDEESMIFCR